MDSRQKHPFIRGKKLRNYSAITTVIPVAFCGSLNIIRQLVFDTCCIDSNKPYKSMWAYYQSKSLKGYLYEIQKEEFELTLKKTGSKVPIFFIRTLRRNDRSLRQ